MINARRLLHGVMGHTQVSCLVQVQQPCNHVGVVVRKPLRCRWSYSEAAPQPLRFWVPQLCVHELSCLHEEHNNVRTDTGRYKWQRTPVELT